jgi:hypothetical protein
MKQNEITVGKKYLFSGQTSEAKKIMQNKIFTVVKIVQGKIKCTSNYRGNKGKSPNRYLLDNGMHANASNLKEVVVSDVVS